MKLLIDMNLSPRWDGVLEDAGFEALHWSDVGPLDAPDAEIVSFASNGDSVVLTHDVVSGAVLAVPKGAKPSVVQLRADDVSPEVAAAVVVTAMNTASAELELGALPTVDATRARIRLLPSGGTLPCRCRQPATGEPSKAKSCSFETKYLMAGKSAI